MGTKKPSEKLKMYDFLIVGAGATGITLAERFANDGKKVLIIDKRNHIGGNCYDYLGDNDIIIQKYGPHIFHTKEETIHSYLSKFTDWTSYKHKVIALYKEKYYPIPINLDTVNTFFNTDLRDEHQLIDFLKTKAVKKDKIENSQDVVISKFGIELYEAFVKYYTKKQWDLYPEELDKSVLERLPIRYNKNPYYFDDKFQGMPTKGFTEMFKKMLLNKDIEIRLETDFFKVKNNIEYKKLIFTGKIDEFFDYKFGKLDYRCINFVFETKDGDFQPNSVVNYTDSSPEFTRITEFKKFYEKQSKKTIICKEFTSWEGSPSYPVLNEKNNKLLEKYLNEAKKLKDTYLAGRLGSYRYLNIDKAVSEALKLYNKIKE